VAGAVRYRADVWGTLAVAGEESARVQSIAWRNLSTLRRLCDGKPSVQGDDTLGCGRRRWAWPNSPAIRPASHRRSSSGQTR
jgi:hypothetical protein